MIEKLFVPSEKSARFALSSALFVRSIGVVYLIAISSLWVQIDGLIGANGILPVSRTLRNAALAYGGGRYLALPTWCWLSSSDFFLHLLCGLGVALAVLVLLGFFSAPALFLLWTVYLSLTVVGADFLSFQWDVLLIESGFLAIFLCPLRIHCRLRCATPASPAMHGLLIWLLFRLMFSSGVVKILSGDPTWRDLTALTYHYQTQPLPTWTAWWAHQLPAWFQAASTLGMFVVELAVPFLLFVPGKTRTGAVMAVAALQALIAATGNYAFFNLLTLALCLPLLEDRFWPRRWRGEPAEDPERGSWPPWIVIPVAGSLLFLSLIQMAVTLRLPIPWPRTIVRIYGWTAPFRTVNGYGLFAVMTTHRPEIVIEGSDDGRNWKEYSFRWKPGDLGRRPRFVAPHQPRLDWQMWFAALGPPEDSPWFEFLLQRLLEGSPEVVGLLAENPFPRGAPRFVRSLLYDYRFTGLEDPGDAWWRRELVGVYTAPASLPGTVPTHRASAEGAEPGGEGAAGLPFQRAVWGTALPESTLSCRGGGEDLPRPSDPPSPATAAAVPGSRSDRAGI